MAVGRPQGPRKMNSPVLGVIVLTLLGIAWRSIKDWLR